MKRTSRQEILTKAVDYLSQADPVMKRIIRQLGPCTLKRKRGGFVSLVETIIHQQLSLTAAKTIHGRLVALAREKRLSPQVLLELTDAQLQQAGVSRPKIRYLRVLAHKTLAGELNFKKFPRMTNEEISRALIEVKGLGQWSADMYLMFVMNRLDVLPTEDLGLRNAVAMAYQLRGPKINWESISCKWRPYRTIACWYLWAFRHIAESNKQRRRT